MKDKTRNITIFVIILIFMIIILNTQTFTNNNNMINNKDLKEELNYNTMFKNTEIKYIELIDNESNLTYKIQFK